MSFAATTTLVNSIATDPAFRTWGSAYSAKFASMGLVQTSDTGQINWTTVLAPTGTQQIMGYEIWRFADTLQSTAPVFLKVQYGSGTVTANAQIWLQLGSGSNGSGSLTGVLSTLMLVTATATGGGATHYWSGDTNRLSIACQGASAATSMFLGVERSVDTSGALTSEACFIYKVQGAAGAQQAWNTVTGPTTVAFETNWGSMGANAAPFGTFGTQLAVYPVFLNKGVFYPYGLNVFCYENATITVNAAVTFSVYGASHTYMPLGNTNFGGASLARGGFSASAPMMRYE